MIDGDARAVLVFAAGHELIAGSEIALLFDGDVERAREALRDLLRDGSLRRVRLSGGWSCFVVTRRGLDGLGSDLPEPAPVLGELGRLRAVARFSALLRAARGAEVPVLSAREMVAGDLRGGDVVTGMSFGVRVGGVRSPTRTGLFYADLVELGSDGWRAVFVRVAPVSVRSLSAVLRAYGAQERFASVQFMVAERRIGAQVRAAARSAGMEDVASVTEARRAGSG